MAGLVDKLGNVVEQIRLYFGGKPNLTPMLRAELNAYMATKFKDKRGNFDAIAARSFIQRVRGLEGYYHDMSNYEDIAAAYEEKVKHNVDRAGK